MFYWWGVKIVWGKEGKIGFRGYWLDRVGRKEVRLI